MIAHTSCLWPTQGRTRESAALDPPHSTPGLSLSYDYSNGSQFFITTVPTPHLNGKHTVFGEGVSGQEFVKAIEAVGDSSGKPSSKVIVAKCGTV